ncbi:hypothetical protein SAMN05444745_1397 [Arthrobacter sp. OV608]|nr:hypothetical protein SAMN05444745_1397 [Arthrobacter sp. OV608]
MTRQRIRYERVSTLERNEKRQLEGQVLDRVFTDVVSGRDTRWTPVHAARFVRLEVVGRGLGGLQTPEDFCEYICR